MKHDVVFLFLQSTVNRKRQII